MLNPFTFPWIGTGWPVMTSLDDWLAETAARPSPSGRPLVSLCYAQSLDGSLASRRGQGLALSGPASLALTHHLRASHQAILVGIGTILADDPSLTVRHAAGDAPQPVILDTHLRFPLEARLWQVHPCPPWIVTHTAQVDMQADSTRARELTRRGAILLPVPLTAAGLSLPTLLQVLHERGIHSVMVEGGARVLASFVRQGLADRLIVTVAPRLVGGLPALSDTGPFQPPIRLENVACYPMPDGDLTVCAQFPASSMI